MSRKAREWVRDLDGRLRGPARALLWALADRANDAGECWPSERRMARESGVSYAQVRRLLDLLVEHGVLEELKPRAGTRPAVYLFTFVDTARLPSALPRRAVGKELVRANGAASARPRRAEPKTKPPLPTGSPSGGAVVVVQTSGSGFDVEEPGVGRAVAEDQDKQNPAENNNDPTPGSGRWTPAQRDAHVRRQVDRITREQGVAAAERYRAKVNREDAKVAARAEAERLFSGEQPAVYRPFVPGWAREQWEALHPETDLDPDEPEAGS